MRESHADLLTVVNIYSLLQAAKLRLPMRSRQAANLRDGPLSQCRPREVDHMRRSGAFGVLAFGLSGRGRPGSIAGPVVVREGAPDVPAVVAVE